jgi:hypothetical protein
MGGMGQPSAGAGSMTKRDPVADKSWTSRKLDWMDAVAADPRVPALAFEVGFIIAQAINARTEIAFVSDDTIADRTGCKRRAVHSARNLLRECGWIEWKRTRTANEYRLRFEKINLVLDMQTVKRDQRAERRQKRRDLRATKAGSDVHGEAHLKSPDVHGETHLDVHGETHIHLRDNTLKKERVLQKGFQGISTREMEWVSLGGSDDFGLIPLSSVH